MTSSAQRSKLVHPVHSFVLSCFVDIIIDRFASTYGRDVCFPMSRVILEIACFCFSAKLMDLFESISISRYYSIKLVFVHENYKTIADHSNERSPKHNNAIIIIRIDESHRKLEQSKSLPHSKGNFQWSIHWRAVRQLTSVVTQKIIDSIKSAELVSLGCVHSSTRRHAEIQLTGIVFHPSTSMPFQWMNRRYLPGIPQSICRERAETPRHIKSN